MVASSAYVAAVLEQKEVIALFLKVSALVPVYFLG